MQGESVLWILLSVRGRWDLGSHQSRARTFWVQDAEWIQEVGAAWKRRWGKAWGPKHGTGVLPAQNWRHSLGFHSEDFVILGAREKVLDRKSVV